MTLEELKEIIRDKGKKTIEIEGEEFIDIKLESLERVICFYNCKFYNCTFNNNNVESIVIKECYFEDCVFENLINKESYITILGTSYKKCRFMQINIESIEQSTIWSNKFFDCSFDNVRLFLQATEMEIMNYNGRLENCFICVSEISTTFKECELIKCTMLGHFCDNEFINVKMIYTKIDGELENNNCINCTLNGKEFVLEDN